MESKNSKKFSQKAQNIKTDKNVSGSVLNVCRNAGSRLVKTMCV